MQAQAALLSDFEYEILVADDGSTDLSTITGNRKINEIENCYYIEREKTWEDQLSVIFSKKSQIQMVIVY